MSFKVVSIIDQLKAKTAFLTPFTLRHLKSMLKNMEHNISSQSNRDARATDIYYCILWILRESRSFLAKCDTCTVYPIDVCPCLASGPDDMKYTYSKNPWSIGRIREEDAHRIIAASEFITSHPGLEIGLPAYRRRQFIQALCSSGLSPPLIDMIGQFLGSGQPLTDVERSRWLIDRAIGRLENREHASATSNFVTLLSKALKRWGRRSHRPGSRAEKASNLINVILGRRGFSENGIVRCAVCTGGVKWEREHTARTFTVCDWCADIEPTPEDPRFALPPTEFSVGSSVGFHGSRGKTCESAYGCLAGIVPSEHSRWWDRKRQEHEFHVMMQRLEDVSRRFVRGFLVN